jgi:Ca-activated chloride channel family protein
MGTIVDFSNLTLTNPIWFWGLCVIPIVGFLLLAFRKVNRTSHSFSDFIDDHLLPHLIDKSMNRGKKSYKKPLSFLHWALLWSLIILALTGPRWGFNDFVIYKPNSKLLICLDLSRSMDVDDVKPTRLHRAKQEILDVLELSKATDVGLIVFANIPHLVSPLTDDIDTIRRLLPSIKTDLIYSHGSNVTELLKVAGKSFLEDETANKHILIISDGEFDSNQSDIDAIARELANKKIHIHTMGVGTNYGAPIPAEYGGYLKKNEKLIISRRNSEKLKSLANAGDGIYIEPNFLENDSKTLLSQISDFKSDYTESEQTIREWEERFYLFLIPFLVLFLSFFRKRSLLIIMVLFSSCFMTPGAFATELKEYFLNQDQLGKMALDQGKPDDAAQLFEDHYRKGVAYYLSGDYEKAKHHFSKSVRPEVKKQAQYNLGNSQLMAGNIKEAIKTYEDVLNDYPEHKSAKHNLEIAKKLLEQSQNQQSQSKQESNQNKNNQESHQEPKDSESQNDPKQSSSSSEQEEENQDGENQSSDNKNEESNNRDSQKDKESPEQENDQNDGYKQDNEQNDQNDRDKQENEQNANGNIEQNRNDQQNSDQKEPSGKNDLQNETAHEDYEDHGKNHENNDFELDKKPQDPVESNRKEYEYTDEDSDTDQWLERIESKPEAFLKKKFYIESRKKGVSERGTAW